MKARKLLIILPVVILATGCDAKASAEKFYYSAKDVVNGKIIDPLLDRVDGGYREIIPETKFEKARRLFCEAVSSPNSYFEISKTKQEDMSYIAYIFADGNYKQNTYSDYEGMKKKTVDDLLSSFIYTSDFYYTKSENGWDKTPTSETTLVDFSSFETISKALLGKGLAEFAAPLDFVMQNGAYTCTSKANISFDETIYTSYESVWFLTIKLDSDEQKLASFTLTTRINYKLIDSEETVGETIIYSGNCVSLEGNKIEIPTIEEEEQEE